MPKFATHIYVEFDADNKDDASNRASMFQEAIADLGASVITADSFREQKIRSFTIPARNT